jgi:hypothetical protein
MILVPLARVPGAFPVDETNTSFLMIVAFGATIGVIGGSIALFFGMVLWKNIEEVPEDGDTEAESQGG